MRDNVPFLRSCHIYVLGAGIRGGGAGIRGGGVGIRGGGAGIRGGGGWV